MAVRSNEGTSENSSRAMGGLIDMVVVNLYPFFENANKDIPLNEKIEFIDIGGPSMLRSAAKNFNSVTVITDVQDYELVKSEMEKKKVV